jgi:hypothetical protein
MTENEAVQWIRRRLEFEAWLNALRRAASGDADPSPPSTELKELVTVAPGGRAPAKVER